MRASATAGAPVAGLPEPVAGGRGVGVVTAPATSCVGTAVGEATSPATCVGEITVLVDVPGGVGDGTAGPPGVAVGVLPAPALCVGEAAGTVDVRVAVGDGAPGLPGVAVGTAGWTGVGVAVEEAPGGVAVGVATEDGVVGVGLEAEPPPTGTTAPGAGPAGGGSGCPDVVASCDDSTLTADAPPAPFGVNVTVKSAQPVPHDGVVAIPTTWTVPAALLMTGATRFVFHAPAPVTPVTSATAASKASVISKPLNGVPASSPETDTVAAAGPVVMESDGPA